VSCNEISKALLANTTPVRPPTVNKNRNPNTHRIEEVIAIGVPWRLANQEKILIPVGTAIIIVADVKYARVSTSIPTVNIWCAHTTKPSNAMALIA